MGTEAPNGVQGLLGYRAQGKGQRRPFTIFLINLPLRTGAAPGSHAMPSLRQALQGPGGLCCCSSAIWWDSLTSAALPKTSL